MNILFISSEYPPETANGGIGTYTFNIASELALSGHNVHVIAAKLGGNEETVSSGGVTVHRIFHEKYPLPENKLFFPLRQICYKLIPHLLVRLTWINAVQKKVNKLFKDGCKFDIIEYPECGGEGLKISYPKTCVLVARLHTPWEIVRKYDLIKEPAGDRILLPLIEKLSVLRAHGITCPSNALSKLIKSKWNIKNIPVIPNPVPVKKFPLTSNCNWIYTGRVERRKGVHILIMAYSRICSKYDPPPLRIVGHEYGILPDKTRYGDYIRKLISESGCSNRIEWIEGCSHEHLIKHLSISSVAFFPSLWENFPYSCLEAMASGLAVVVSDCGGFPEIVDHNKNGLVVKTDSIDNWENAMKQLILNSGLKNLLGQNGRKKVQSEFDSKKVCKEMESFYFRILEEKRT